MHLSSSSPDPSEDISRLCCSVIDELDGLFLGPRQGNTFTSRTRHNDSAACRRAVASICSRVKSGPKGVVRRRLSSCNFPYEISDKPEWQSISELCALHASSHSEAPLRGDFRPIDAERIDLPLSSHGDSSYWVNRVPTHVRHLFNPLSEDHLRNVLADRIHALGHTAPPVPPALLHCLKGHYGRTLALADDTSILDWSVLFRAARVSPPRQHADHDVVRCHQGRLTGSSHKLAAASKRSCRILRKWNYQTPAYFAR